MTPLALAIDKARTRNGRVFQEATARMKVVARIIRVTNRFHIPLTNFVVIGNAANYLAGKVSECTSTIISINSKEIWMDYIDTDPNPRQPHPGDIQTTRDIYDGATVTFIYEPHARYYLSPGYVDSGVRYCSELVTNIQTDSLLQRFLGWVLKLIPKKEKHHD